jgi:hypothetical protein
VTKRKISLAEVPGEATPCATYWACCLGRRRQRRSLCGGGGAACASVSSRQVCAPRRRRCAPDDLETSPLERSVAK